MSEKESKKNVDDEKLLENRRQNLNNGKPMLE